MAKKITPIDTHMKTKRVWLTLSIIMWLGSLFMKITNHVKIIKRNKLPKPPYLLLSTHASMMDFYAAILGTFPHQPYWVSTVEEFIYRFWLFRHMGILAKRKFTNDPINTLQYMDVLQKRKKILVIYPEARYSFVGERERLDAGLGKFVKSINVPVVVLRGHGNYLYQPQWSDRKIRKVRPMVEEMETVISKYDLEVLTPEEIHEKINNALVISEEDWMLKKNIKITYPDRAVGLHRILYKCPHCGEEFKMSSTGHILKCDACGIEYDYLENGMLKCLNGETKFDRPSKWYYWEKEEVRKEVEAGTYFFEDDVRVEKLIGAKVGFVPQEGHYHLTHSIKDGFQLRGDNGFTYDRSSLQSYAVHIEYNYMDKRGAFIDLATMDDSYFVYPLNKPLYLTKIHFAVECIYDHFKKELKS